MTIGIIDLNFGNLGSVERMISKVGGISNRITKSSEILEAEKIILPGVGHFETGIRTLKSSGIVDPLRKSLFERRVPFLGICLGMHLICKSSEEGDELGLGFIDADVKKFDLAKDSNLKVPHMGWNSVRPTCDSVLFKKRELNPRYYFVHSYFVEPKSQNIVIGETQHGDAFCSAFQDENIFGVQFHPEKSHRFGMDLFRSFLEL